MFSSLTVVVALALASTCKMAAADCPCYPYEGNTTALVCRDSSLTTIPDCVGNDTDILIISTASIPLVPETIRRFTKLRIISVWLFDNPQISKSFLSAQSNISAFGFSSTSLDYVDSDWFLHATRIKWLFFPYNKIPSLASDTFRSLPLLEKVDLQNNLLTTLPLSLFEDTSLKNLYLGGNPWHCDCDLARFMQWTRDHEVSVYDGAYCKHPVELRGMDLRLLTLDNACGN